MKKLYLILATCLIMVSKTSGAHEIGEYYQGGVIFYVDSTLEHGLIAAASDQGVATWRKRQYNTGATHDGLYSGKYNTGHILDALGLTGTYAARLASACRDGGYSDWYLPSKYELDLMFKQRFIIGEFSLGEDIYQGVYWSSTVEYNTATKTEYQAWVQKFNDKGRTYSLPLDTHSARIRAIRSF